MTASRLTVPRRGPLAAAALIATVAATPAATAHATTTLDLRHARTTEIIGARPGDHAGGGSVVAAGDVNGDGLADVLVSAPGADAPGRPNAGAIYVVFGRRRTHLQAHVVVSRARATALGFRIIGPERGDRLRIAAAAGDVNGDGLGDLVVGVPDERHGQGAAYVVFGRRGGGTVDLAHLGDRGIRITSSTRSTYFGMSVAGGRDVDGDGRPDVVIAQAPAGLHTAYVVFGGTPAGTLSVPDGLGDHGYAIEDAGGSVTLAADMNGDRRAEVVTGTSGGLGAALAAVTFGRARGAAPVDLKALAPGDGFLIDAPPDVQANGGAQVSGGDDVDGDGRGDVILATMQRVRQEAGGLRMLPDAPSVVFGSPDGATVTLGTPSPRLLTLTFPSLPDPFIRFKPGAGVVNGFSPEGRQVSVVGDLDHDGHADVAFNGAADVRGRRGAGSAWLVGGRGPGTTRLVAMRGALRIDGAYAGDGLSTIAAAGGDFDGDGRPDLILGAEDATRNGRAGAGLAWIVSGARP